jgi:allantoinase
MKILQRPYCWKSWDISFALQNQLQARVSGNQVRRAVVIVAGGAQPSVRLPCVRNFPVPRNIFPVSLRRAAAEGGSMVLNTVVEFLAPKAREFGLIAGTALVLAVQLPSATFAQDGIDRVTGFPRDPVHVAAWPGGRKVAVSFALFVEEFGFGQGPVFRPDLASRNPDLVNEAFRQYAIDWGIPRVGRLFRELDVPLSIVLNAEFPGTHASVWKEFRATQPNAPVVAHGMNNTSHMLPLGQGLTEQKAYIRRALDLIAGTTGVKPSGWSSPSVYSNGDTMQAMAAEGITYNLDQMDSDIISRLETPDGPLVLLPYPVVTVDMGQNLARMKTPAEIETLWLDYVSELAREARANPAREATTVVIGIHPFVIGTPDGAAALRRVLLRLKTDDAVWLTDTDAVLKAAALK